MLLALAVLFVSCEGNPSTADSIVDTLTIRLSDGTKDIGYTGAESGYASEGGATAITDYKIYVFEGATVPDDHSIGLYEASGYLDAANTDFQINNVTTGTYSFYVEGLIQKQGTAGESDDDFFLIATGTQENVYISPVADEISIEVGTFDPATAQDITIDLTLPLDLIDSAGDITGTLTWNIYSVDDLATADYTGTVDAATMNGGITGNEADGYHYNLVIPAATNVAPGKYVLNVSIASGDERGAYANADSLRVLPGLPATGAMNLDAIKPDSYPFSVTDGIGGVIEMNAANNTYDATDGNVNIVLTAPVNEGYTVMWFVDGVQTEITSSDGGTTYPFTGLQSGIRNITGIVYDPAMEAAIGSVAVRVNVAAEVSITPAN